MSYKKFSRNHGKTSRVKKYKWSNPDHRWSDSRSTKSAGRPSLHGYIGIPDARLVVSVHGGTNCRGMKTKWARIENRKLRRLLRLEITIR